MKKTLLIALLFSIINPILHAQFTLQGVLLKKTQFYEKGDTVKVFGSRISPGSGKKQYLITARHEIVFVNTSKVYLLDSGVDYWAKVWFDNRGVKVRQSSLDLEKRKTLASEALEYYAQAKGNNLIYEDDALYDYIYQLLLKIHPDKLVKPEANNLGLIIIKSNSPDYFSFDNGFIVLTTGLLAGIKEEKELIKVLSNCISHLVLEHNLINLNKKLKAERRAELWATFTIIASSVAMISSNQRRGTNYNIYDALDIGLSVHFLSSTLQESIGADYSKLQAKKAEEISNDFREQFMYKASPDETFINKISGVISYTAWQEYNVMNYDYAIELINRIQALNLVTERDYLLLSKLYRATSNSKESNLEALSFIQKGKSMGFTFLIDFDKEAGLLYLRLNDKAKAKQSFLSYKENLLDLEKQAFDVAFDLEFVNQVLYKNKMLD